MISRYEFQFSFFSQSITKIAITVAAVLTFSQIVVQLFGQKMKTKEFMDLLLKEEWKVLQLRKLIINGL